MLHVIDLKLLLFIHVFCLCSRNRGFIHKFRLKSLILTTPFRYFTLFYISIIFSTKHTNYRSSHSLIINLKICLICFSRPLCYLLFFVFIIIDDSPNFRLFCINFRQIKRVIQNTFYFNFSLGRLNSLNDILNCRTLGNLVTPDSPRFKFLLFNLTLI